MSYNFNSIPSIPPTGSVAPYVGVTDPSGWVICDGNSRSNASGQYNNLINAGLINQNTFGTNAVINYNTSVNNPNAVSIAVNSTGQYIFITGYNSNRFSFSANYGLNWQTVGTGLRDNINGLAMPGAISDDGVTSVGFVDWAQPIITRNLWTTAALGATPMARSCRAACNSTCQYILFPSSNGFGDLCLSTDYYTTYTQLTNNALSNGLSFLLRR